MAKEILLPKLGVTMEEGRINKWLKKVGDYINAGDMLFEIETDKTAMEVESTECGYLKRIVVDEGMSAPVTSVVAILGDFDEVIDAPSSAITDITKTENKSSTAIETAKSEVIVNASLGTQPIATPRAGKIAKENGIDIAKVKGTGGNGRITEDDVLKYMEQIKEAVPELKCEDEELPFTGIRRTIAQRLTQSYQQSPHIYFNTEVDMQRCMDIRAGLKDQGKGSISISDFIIKACAEALTEFSMANSSLKDDRIILHKDVNIGFAVDAPKGLIVPVIFNVQSKNLSQISEDRKHAVDKAMAGTLDLHDIQGGTFTISNLGSYGIDSFTAIINPAESAILAVGAIKKKPVVDDNDAIRIRPIMNITLSVDHRIIDGALAAKVVKRIKEYLEQPELDGEA